MTSRNQQVLDTIRQTHNTCDLSTDAFVELCNATAFYLKGGFSVEEVARLVIEEVFPPLGECD